MPRTILLLAGLLVVATDVGAAEVTGRIAMPPVCSPAVSPAVVVLSPAGEAGASTPAEADTAAVTLIRQSGLQFLPRVRAMTLGGTLEFTNEDTETHNVHITGAGLTHNES